MAIRLLIADDTAEFRKSARSMLALERELEVVAVARDGQEAVELAEKLQPDVAVMDINMPRLDGLTAIKAIAKVSPATVCMIMSSEGERDMLVKAMQAGVREYVLKPFTVEEFVSAVRRAMEQAAEVKKKIVRTQTAELERDKYLLQLVQAHLQIGRIDDEAARAYAEYITRPSADPALMVTLAKIFLERRDWLILRYICVRMEKLAAANASNP
ncbi:MAG: response regulator [Chloroflexi bacterium]|nr:response regulator [Chloroflexota bacterium]